MGKPTQPGTPEADRLFERVADIIAAARSSVARAINHELLAAYWEIGREMVAELQAGEPRADYGKRVIETLSKQLTKQFGKGFSVPNLWNFRQFYLTYSPNKTILSTARRELQTADHESDSSPMESSPQRVENSRPRFHPKLSWSHYRTLMRVEKPAAREFYEKEAGDNGWSVRQLERQVASSFYERLLKSRGKKAMLAEVAKADTPIRPIDVIKDPYVLEFLDLPESHQLQEEGLEAALIDALQAFLLELGSGFAFVGRQQRMTLDGDHFYPDLIFYHIRLRCYVIVDLKVAKLTHGDIGQMQMYVNYYDREVRAREENPTIGLILCADKNDAMVKYVLGETNEQIFASRYRLELPDEETLRKELEHERRLIEGRQR